MEGVYHYKREMKSHFVIAHKSTRLYTMDHKYSHYYLSRHYHPYIAQHHRLSINLLISSLVLLQILYILVQYEIIQKGEAAYIDSMGQRFDTCAPFKTKFLAKQQSKHLIYPFLRTNNIYIYIQFEVEVFFLEDKGHIYNKIEHCQMPT